MEISDTGFISITNHDIATINHMNEDIIHLYLDGELIETAAEHP